MCPLSAGLLPHSKWRLKSFSYRLLTHLLAIHTKTDNSIFLFNTSLLHFRDPLPPPPWFPLNSPCLLFPSISVFLSLSLAQHLKFTNHCHIHLFTWSFQPNFLGIPKSVNTILCVCVCTHIWYPAVFNSMHIHIKVCIQQMVPLLFFIFHFNVQVQF